MNANAPMLSERDVLIRKLIEKGNELTNASNIQSFVNELQAADEEYYYSLVSDGDILKTIFKHHYGKGSQDVFNKLLKEYKQRYPNNTVSGPISAPRGQFYDVVHSDDGHAYILIGTSLYKQGPSTNNRWRLVNLQGGGKRKTRKTRKARKSRKLRRR